MNSYSKEHDWDNHDTVSDEWNRVTLPVNAVPKPKKSLGNHNCQLLGIDIQVRRKATAIEVVGGILHTGQSQILQVGTPFDLLHTHDVQSPCHVTARFKNLGTRTIHGNVAKIACTK